MNRPSALFQMLVATGFAALSGACLYLYAQLSHVNPWTLNIARAGYRFATRSDACTALLVAMRTVDPKRIDVGIAQINMGWNGHRFGLSVSPCEALDPYKNLDVAARMLAELRADGGDWLTVAGRYHRPAGGAPAARYRELFAKHLRRITGLTLLATNP